jgi:hypothetical protein
VKFEDIMLAISITLTIVVITATVKGNQAVVYICGGVAILVALVGIIAIVRRSLRGSS